jgi:hypothetical protein
VRQVCSNQLFVFLVGFVYLGGEEVQVLEDDLEGLLRPGPAGKAKNGRDK